MYKLLIIATVFLLGLYFIFKSNTMESFTDRNGDKFDIAEKCPDVLIQKGAAFFLYNSKRASVPGVNPIRFDSLEEYVEFTEWQRNQGILCPVLYLQHAYNAQGEPVYKARPSPTNLQGGQPDYYVTPASLPGILPPPANVPIEGICAQKNVMGALSQNCMPTNFTPNSYTGANVPTTGGNYSGFDPQNQSIGVETPLDKMYNQSTGVSPNPMDDNWGGVEYTESLIRAGYYKDNEVSISTA